MTPRTIDIRTAELLTTLHARCVEQSLWLSLDFNGLRSKGTWWIVQVFDHTESTIITGRGETLAAAVAEAHQRFFAKTMGA